MPEKIIRISKDGGSEEEVDRATVERIAKLNYKDVESVMELFNQGVRIQSPFAYYELRKSEVAANA